MTITLTEKQQKVLSAVKNAEAGDVIVLRGFAGTGKSVTAAEIMRTLSSKTLVITPTAAALSVLKTKLSDQDDKKIDFKTIASLMTRHQQTLKLGDFKTFYPTIVLNEDDLDLLKQVSDNDLQTVYDIIDEISDMVPSMKKEDVENAFELSYFSNQSKTRLKTREEFRQFVQYSDEEIDLDRFTLVIDTDALEKSIVDAFSINPFGEISEESQFDYRSLAEISADIEKYALVVIDEMSMMSERQAEIYMSAISSLMSRDIPDAPVTLVTGDPGQLKPVEGSFNKWCNLEEDEETVFELKDVLRSTDEISIFGQMIRSNVPLDLLATSEDRVKVYNRGTTIKDLYLDNEDKFAESDIALAFTNKDVNELNTMIRNSKRLIGHVQKGDKIVVNKNTGYSYKNGIIHTNGSIYDVTDDLTDLLIDKMKSLRDVLSNKQLSMVLSALSDGSIKYLEVKDSENRDRHILAQSNCYSLTSRDLKELSQVVNKILRNSLGYMDSQTLKSFFNSLGESDDDRFPYLVEVKFAHAMTVHKSQGSQFKKVVYVVSSKDLWIQSKDLADSRFKQSPVYVAVTRAQEDVTVLYIK